jgi:type IV pilus assembly protein PilY1
MSRESYPRIKVRSLAGALLAAVFVFAVSYRDASALDQYPGDTVIYGVSTGTIQPNVLVILDNSGSMSEEIITGAPYTPSTTYAVTNSCNGAACQPNAVYKWKSGESTWLSYIANVSSVTCTNALTGFNNSGTYQGKLSTGGACSGKSGSFALGNYINWLAGGGGTRAKMEVAKEVLSDLLNSTSGVRIGMMIFNTSEGGHIAGVGDSYGYSGYQSYIKDMDTIFSGTVTNRTALVNTVNNVSPSTWTPLGETLFEAMRYYKGGATAFNGSYTYTTPVQYACQKNYVILITDGMSTQDRNAVLRTICSNGDCDGDGFEPANDPTKTYASDGSDYLDDVAKYLYDSDLLTDGVDEKTIGKQNVITYTVGFGLAGVDYAERLLQETATNGGGVYYSAGSTGGLSESLRQIIASIVEDDTSFVAPVLPVSPENRTYTGDRLYMGFFKPKSNAFWSGNLKKYGLDVDGNILDRYGNFATNADGSIKDNAISYWGTVSDGSDVENGGAGALLLTRSTSRNIYTYTGSSASLTAASNAFTTSNAAITAATLGVADSTEKDKLINFVYGLDAYDEDGNGVTTEKRDWILGDVLHSKPTVVNYTTFTMAEEGDCSINRSLVFVGSNDGMMHAFKDCDGSELWAFVPQDLLPNLQYSHGTTHSYFVDSSPTTYVYDADRDGNIETADSDKVIVMFGERRGGGFYYALDVTDPASPQYLWRLSATESPFSDDYSELAETWSEPVIAKVYVDSGGTNVVKVAAFIGAGYDNVAEDAEPAATATKGRGVYAVEIATLSSGVPVFTTSGHRIWGYTMADNGSLTRPISSQIAILDINGNGYADRLYAGDTGGGLWRFDIGSNLTSSWTGRKIFQSNPGADSSTGRKIFYKPAVTLEVGYEMLFFGTGDRSHPVSATEVNRLYAVKDSGQTVAKTESDLSDATSAASVNIASTYGWYAKLNTNTEEKVLAQAAVFGGIAYYTTYTPVVTASMCSTGGGTSRLYALEYLTAGAAYNYNTSNDTDGVAVKDSTDRSTIIGSGIASGIVTVVSPRGFTALVGSGGAIVKPDVKQSGSSIPTYWREVR